MNPAELAKAAIYKYVFYGQRLPLPSDLSTELKGRAGAFVSIHSSAGELRGCVGTVLPTKDNLALEIIDNSIAAAEDDRFLPLEKTEVDDLLVSVDILTVPELVSNLAKLDAKKYGVIVRTLKGRCGVLLPDLPDVNTPEEQIAICKRKAGIGPDEPIQIERFEVKRFHLREELTAQGEGALN
jgi:AmmeMemoRadiSam system protein A